MYIKGCENTKNDNFDRDRYRANYEHIFGKSHSEGITKFPSGKGIYDEKTKTWVDMAEFKSKQEYNPRLLLLKDNPNPLEIITQDKETGKRKVRYEYKKLRF